MKSKTTARRPQTRQPDARWWESPIVWVSALIALAIVVAAIISLAGGDDEPDSNTDLLPSALSTALASETAPVETVGAPLPPFADPDTAIGSSAPSITATTIDGDPVTITEDGTARLFGFFAHWCPHCQDELPIVSAWLKANPLPEGVEMIAVSTGVDPTAPNFPPSAWFEREQWPTTVLVDSPTGDLAAGFGLTAFPFWVAVDGDGTVLTRLSGRLTEAEIAALVQALTPQIT